MTNKHTPGPWHQDKYGNIIGPDGEKIVTTGLAITTGYSENEEPKANARLIAAAPETAAERDRLKEINAELLAALVAMEELVVGSGLNGASQQVAKARAAIAKATGQALQDLADIGQELNI